MSMPKQGFVLLLSSLLAAAPAQAQEPLRVDITEGVASPMPIAIPDVPAPGVHVADVADPGSALAQIIRHDLSGTALYRLLAVQPLREREGTDLAPFQKIGTQALVVGQVSLDAGQLHYDCLLYDVFAARLQMEKRFTVQPAQWRRLAHQCADMVFEATTGYPGYFDTRILFVADEEGRPGEGSRLAVVDQDGANRRLVAPGPEQVAMPRFSPDNRYAAAMRWPAAQQQIILTELSTGSTRIFRTPPGVASAPRFSPDGRSLLFSLAKDGEADLYRLDIASGESQQLTFDPGTDTSPDYAPDGRSIVFESSRSGSQQIYVMPAEGGTARRLTFGAGAYASPAWSPEGAMIAFTHIDGDTLRIGVMRADGSRERLLTSGPRDEDPAWAPGGRALAFQRTAAGGLQAELWSTDLAGKVQRRIEGTFPASSPAWSRTLP